MNNRIRVELSPRMVPLDDEAHARRSETVERLGDLGQIDPSAGEVAELMQRGWIARINGVEVHAHTYSVEPGDGPDIVLSLMLAVDSLSIGDPSLAGQAADARPAVPDPLARPMWGTGTATIGAQVAATTEKAASA